MLYYLLQVCVNCEDVLEAKPVEEVVGDGFVDDHTALVLEDLLKCTEAVHHHHRVRIPQQAVQFIHNSGIYRANTWWKHHQNVI